MNEDQKLANKTIDPATHGSQAARNIALAFEAANNRYFNFEDQNAVHLEPIVDRMRERYNELKSSGRDFSNSARIALIEMAQELIDL